MTGNVAVVLQHYWFVDIDIATCERGVDCLVPCKRDVDGNQTDQEPQLQMQTSISA